MFGKIIHPSQRLWATGFVLGSGAWYGTAFAQPAPVAVPAAPAACAPACKPKVGSRIHEFWQEATRPAPEPPPLGSCLNAWASVQIARAELQELYITLNEWYLGGATLGPAGRRHIERLARSIIDSTSTIYVEPADDTKLNERRLLAIAQELKKFGVTNAEKRVSLATPLAEGLAGEEAVRIYPRLFFIRGFGGGGGGGGGGLGGMGGGNSGGGGLGIGGFGGSSGRGGN